MELTIDTKNKTIQLNEFVGLGHLIETLEGMFPKGRWKEFKIQGHTQYWTQPIYVPYEPLQTFPWYDPNVITYDNDLTMGIYSVSISN